MIYQILIFLLAFTGYSSYSHAHPTYIAFYTVQTPYEDEIQKLKESLELFNLEFNIQGVPNLGSWQKNTQYKAVFIKDMLDKYPDQPIVYLDADAVVRSFPILFDEIDCDIAVHYYDNKKRNIKELLSGTIYFGHTAKAKELVQLWIDINKEFPEQWDQKNLDIAIKRMPELKIVELPASYCLIFDLMKDQGPAVIEHFQASRRHKHAVNSNSP